MAVGHGFERKIIFRESLRENFTDGGVVIDEKDSSRASSHVAGSAIQIGTAQDAWEWFGCDRHPFVFGNGGTGLECVPGASGSLQFGLQ
jgi:hypothetical protein